MIASLKLDQEERKDVWRGSCKSSSSSSVEVIDLNEPVPYRFEYRPVLKKSLQNFDAVLGQFKSVYDREDDEQNELPKQTIFQKKISKNITGDVTDSQLNSQAEMKALSCPSSKQKSQFSLKNIDKKRSYLKDLKTKDPSMS